MDEWSVLEDAELGDEDIVLVEFKDAATNDFRLITEELLKERDKNKCGYCKKY